MNFILLTLTGLSLGLAVVVPGMSAGTMAVVFNVHDRLIGIIAPNIKKILAQWKFWLPLAIGAGIGIILFIILISFLLENYEIPIYMFFIGLIIGSIPLIYRKIKSETSILPPMASITCIVIALAVMIIFAFVEPEKKVTVYTEITLNLFVLLLLGGFLSALAMIIPGLSGSFMLLVIGLYHTVIQAGRPPNFNFPILGVFAIGVIAGLLSGAAGIRCLLAKVPSQTYGAVLGLVAGSVFVLFPGGFGSGILVIFSLISLLAGFAISFFFGRKKI